VILVRERRAEKRHDAIPHHLVDGSLVIMDGVHHELDDRIEYIARLFWIALGKQLHGPLEVGKENSDLLAFAFKSTSGAKDPLG
jgi:hypothetical protein